jgi:hypothetical protein
VTIRAYKTFHFGPINVTVSRSGASTSLGTRRVRVATRPGDAAPAPRSSFRAGIGCGRGRAVDSRKFYPCDDFGVPANALGPGVPEAFYGALGRIVALGAIVEHHLAAVVTQLEHTNEESVAGIPFVGLVKRYDAVLLERATAGAPLSERFYLLGEDAQKVMHRRNAVVHSLWPNPTTDAAQGWRLVAEKLQVDPSTPVIWTSGDLPALRTIIDELVRLIDELRDIVQEEGAW